VRVVGILDDDCVTVPAFSAIVRNNAEKFRRKESHHGHFSLEITASIIIAFIPFGKWLPYGN
jgi:hypothetical protein